MTSIPRPSLEQAAQTWLAQTDASMDDPKLIRLRAALEDFLAKRFHGAAADLRAVHDLRNSLLDDGRSIESHVAEGAQSWDRSSLGKAASDSAPPELGRLLFSLVWNLRPGSVLELGTNIGISAAYLQVGLQHTGGGELTTIEASGARLVLAERHFDALGLAHPNWVEGYFDDVLADCLAEIRPPDLAFIDGNHREDATVRYFHLVGEAMPAGAVMVFDDIRWSEGMLGAWEEISRSTAVTASVDLGRIGLVVRS